MNGDVLLMFKDKQVNGLLEEICEIFTAHLLILRLPERHETFFTVADSQSASAQRQSMTFGCIPYHVA